MILPLLIVAFSLTVQYFFQEQTLKDYFPLTVCLLYKGGGSTMPPQASSSPYLDSYPEMAELQKLHGFFLPTPWSWETERKGKSLWFNIYTKFHVLLPHYMGGSWFMFHFKRWVYFTFCVTLVDGCIYHRVNNAINLLLFREKETESFASVIMANRSSIGLLNYHQQWGTPLG